MAVRTISTYNKSYSCDKGYFEKMLSKCNSLVIVSRAKSNSQNDLKCSKGSFPNCFHLVNDDASCFNDDWSKAFDRKKANKTKNDLIKCSRDPLTCREIIHTEEKRKQSQSAMISDMLHPYHSESLERLKIISDKMKVARMMRNSQVNWNLERLVSKSDSQGRVTTPKEIKFVKNKIQSLARNCRGRGTKQQTRSRIPDILFCYICGHQYGRSSLPFHERQCLKKWHIINNRRPLSNKRTPPKKFKGNNPESMDDMTVSAIKQRQDIHWKMYLENRPLCKFCKKRFSPFKIDSHEAICKKVKKPYNNMARRIQLEKLQNRMEISHRFSLSRSPLLSLISRLKVIATEEIRPKKINLMPKPRQVRSRRNLNRLLKHKSEPAKLQVIPSKSRTKSKLQIQNQSKPQTPFTSKTRSSPKIILPEITVEEDLITKIENWQMRSLWEDSEEVMKLMQQP